MSPNPTPPSADTLLAASKAAKATLATAQAATVAARAPWTAALVACGILPATSQRKPGPPAPPAKPPVVAPSPLPDFAGLGKALTTAVIAENVARAAYETAKQALSAAMAGA
jgi:hypothetical protein